MQRYNDLTLFQTDKTYHLIEIIYKRHFESLFIDIPHDRNKNTTS